MPKSECGFDIRPTRAPRVGEARGKFLFGSGLHEADEVVLQGFSTAHASLFINEFHADFRKNAGMVQLRTKALNPAPFSEWHPGAAVLRG